MQRRAEGSDALPRRIEMDHAGAGGDDRVRYVTEVDGQRFNKGVPPALAPNSIR